MKTFPAQLLLSIILLPNLSTALASPPIPSDSHAQQYRFSPSSHDTILEDTEFAGLTTYANLPYVYCLAHSSEDLPTSQHYDIAILGAPFDTATTYRPGARFGPRGIRSGSARILPPFAYDPETLFNPFRDWARVVDCGDVPMTFLDNTLALQQLQEGYRRVVSRASHSKGRNVSDTGEAGVPPRVVMLGGDHTTTLSALREVGRRWGEEVSVIHFDSHLDTWRPDVLGAGKSEYAGVNHGTFLHWAYEEGLVKANSSTHVGIRAPVFGKGDLKEDGRCGFDIVHARSIDRVGVKEVVERVKRRVGHGLVYVTVDIDVLDPAYAPGTGTAEVGGWTTRELLTVLEGLEGLRIVGADVVEVAPAYDNAGETTVLAAAEVVKTLVGLMVGTPVKASRQE